MLKQDLVEYLSPFGQSHLVEFWDELADNEKDQLLADIKQTNFAEINEFFVRSTSTSSMSSTSNQTMMMEKVANELKGSCANSSPELLGKYEQLGLKAIAQNQVAVLLLAGGQGTRLGVDYPKGMYSVGLPSNKSLFQIQAERLVRLKHLAQGIGVLNVLNIYGLRINITILKPKILDFFSKNEKLEPFPKFFDFFRIFEKLF
jgi:UDP-N-acetylglucosamine/UDP-N-acetylgalactosamine diphosphorylase